MEVRSEPGLVKWSSNASYDAFLHISLQHRVVSLYEPTSTSENRVFPFKQASKHEDIHQPTTYDWSPTVRGLVAIGTGQGIVNLLRVDDGSNAYLELAPRLQRQCQAVAFSTQGKLAVGLDRVRNDQCLYIWDVNQVSSLDAAVPGFPNLHFPEPLHRLEPSVSVSSIKFFEDNPNTLVVGIKAQGLRIHDLRDPGGAVVTFQTKCNNNLAIDYADQNYFASSSLDQPHVMVWDRRAGSRNDGRPHSSTAMRTYLEAVDGGHVPWGGSLRLDDLVFHDPEASKMEKSPPIRSLRYCRDHSGMLGILSRTGQLKAVTVTKENGTHEYESGATPELLRVGVSHEMDPMYIDAPRRRDEIVSFDWATLGTPALRPRMVALRSSGKFEILERPTFTATHASKLIPWTAPHRGLEANDDYHTTVRFEQSYSGEMLGSLLVENSLTDEMAIGMDKNGENKRIIRNRLRKVIESSAPHEDPIEDTMAPTFDLPKAFSQATTVADKLRVLRARSTDVPTPLQPLENGFHGHAHLHESLRGLSTSDTHSGPASSREVHHKLLEITMNPEGLPREAQCVVDHTMYLRAKERYLFDFASNTKVVSEDPWLQNMWGWLAGAESAALDAGMVAHPFILDYLGVSNIWANNLGRRSSSRLIDQNADPDAVTWERCLGQIAKKQHLPKFDGTQTKWPHHRQVCLAICEWGQSSAEEMDDQVPVSERMFTSHTKATAHALFKGDTEGAVQILKKASPEHPELLFVSLAIQLIGRGDLDLAKEQLDFDETVASKTDPYLRAISSLIATGEWTSIVNQDALPLRDRVFVAVRYFSDGQLSTWLREQTALAVDHGDIDGIVLTGVSDRMVDIFSKYIEKFHDFQTAALVMSICAPRYIDDQRCKAWRTAYRGHLQRHQAFYSRTKFEVESTKRSKQNGKPLIKPPYRQIALRCIFCDAQMELQAQHGMAPPAVERVNPLMATGISAGISCGSCGRHLPYCAVCHEVVGIPRSDRPEVSQDPEVRLAGRFPTFCLKCEHVLHLDHAREWFARHVECPVPECRCKCNFRANPELNYH